MGEQLCIPGPVFFAVWVARISGHEQLVHVPPHDLGLDRVNIVPDQLLDQPVHLDGSPVVVNAGECVPAELAHRAADDDGSPS